MSKWIVAAIAASISTWGTVALMPLVRPGYEMPWLPFWMIAFALSVFVNYQLDKSEKP